MAKRLTDKDKKKIIADYIETQNYRETGRMNNISDVAVRNIVMQNEDTLTKLEQKKEQNTLDTLDYIQSLKEKKTRILKLLLTAIEEKAKDKDNKIKQNVKDLATAYGIILDKDMKILEIQRGSANNEELNKVKELLSKIEGEAENGIK